MSFNQPPPNPYGPPQPPAPQPGYGYPQQPPAANPYAQPQPQGPNPYAQGPAQPPAPPYGQPPVPGAPGPYGQPQGWGAGPVPPPLPVKKSNKGKIVGIVAGVVVVAAIAVGAVTLTGATSSGGGYKLDTPATVLGGQYTKDSTMPGATGGDSDTQKGSDKGITDATSVRGAWKSSKDEIILGGAYGDVTDPKSAVGTLLSAAGMKDATDQKPSGFDGDLMQCGVKDFGIYKAPFCAWGDNSTVALVMWNGNPDTVATGGLPTPPSTADFAQTVAKLRGEIRVKK
ncbi:MULTISPECIES: hypothetical protein [Streptomycetaceae]|uniref:Uncharacterized protein n=1 Tax=Streptantibioticus cattleyicolor (strain ATCC 35852 / DSM 46488 / JCM 4925 / NBRC 14057 / NRRL 8057) TaxID=1003195 RepID=F8JR17_STREN|nr:MULTISPECIES: hypothetical protein [Streptomycetaceae]AEW94103.1 hypothetical protein SCATT_17320 [Streptantibioticus cattleyicolor NRRL 8057 = DSM 46488]MYS58771.1 hypothetical protein [Streptomyces sp. SID5468]CCB74458.1 conserved protein of unknown function [Streptantibioticus cattleyicolor NRRL 8057 = DSM 46488]